MIYFASYVGRSKYNLNQVYFKSQISKKKCWVADGYKRFEGIFCLHLQSNMFFNYCSLYTVGALTFWWEKLI